MPPHPLPARAGLLAAFFLFLLLPLPAHAASLSPEAATSLEEGNKAFDRGDFPSAITAFQKVVDSGFISPDLFLLLGNAHFRAGSPGQAVLWWRRAQVADPLLAEPSQNLRFLDSKAAALRFPQDKVSSVTTLLPRDLWAIAAAAGSWAFIIGLTALSLHLPRKLWRTSAHLACWIGLTIAALGTAGYLLKSKRDLPFVTGLAIVTSPTTARTSATDDGATVVDLPPGSEISSLGERGPWVYVGIPGDLRGWIRQGASTPLWPFDQDWIQ